MDEWKYHHENENDVDNDVDDDDLEDDGDVDDDSAPLFHFARKKKLRATEPRGKKAPEEARLLDAPWSNMSEKNILMLFRFLRKKAK